MSHPQHPNTTAAAALSLGVDADLLARVIPILRNIKGLHHPDDQCHPFQIQIHYINGRFPGEQWMCSEHGNYLLPSDD